MDRFKRLVGLRYWVHSYHAVNDGCKNYFAKVQFHDEFRVHS